MKTEDLKSTENWAHLNPLILRAGRCEHYIPPGLDDEKREELENELNEKDKTEERFRAIAEDKQLPGEVDAWSQRLRGDQQIYGSDTYATNLISSNRWPGAVTVSKGRKYFSIYVGDGVKNGDSVFNPTEPPMIMSDPGQDYDHDNMRYVQGDKQEKKGEEDE